MTRSSTGRCEQWLEIVKGDAPVLLIAPHGGRAGAAARATLHPKVNDLETAEITRELAARLGAKALINTAMDRNELDCNRLSQIDRRAPWLLELIADQLTEIVQRAGQATVLVIHGWNIIEPRIDLGLGVREVGGILRPPPGAHVTASDTFIHGPVSALAARLREAQIQTTFGLRYPGAAAHNLLQGFTIRHAGSDAASLRRLARIAEAGSVNALQLEMSVALRLPGEFRERALEAIGDAFVDERTPRCAQVPAAFSPPISIVRRTLPSSTRKNAASSAPPSRVGVEFYDPAARLGGMVSFDFGPGAAGGRIMILFDGCRVALFTAEGQAQRTGNHLSIGPLILDAAPGGKLQFRGPAVTVDDGTAYLSVEQALATSRLDRRCEVEATFEFYGAAASFSDILVELDELFAEGHRSRLQPGELSLIIPPHAAFGRMHGSISLNNNRRVFDANFRLGASFTGLGPQKFVTRRMIWSNFTGNAESQAFEARALELDGGAHHWIARVLRNDGWTGCNSGEIRIERASSFKAPERLAAAAMDPNGGQLSIEGRPGTFVMLSRPGPEGTRLHTTLGFAEFRLGDAKGAGMYEFSQRVGVDSGGEHPSEDQTLDAK